MHSPVEYVFIIGVVITICFLAFTFSSCEVKRMEQTARNNQWMVTCVEKGGKIVKLPYVTNGIQYVHDSCELDKK